MVPSGLPGKIRSIRKQPVTRRLFPKNTIGNVHVVVQRGVVELRLPGFFQNIGIVFKKRAVGDIGVHIAAKSLYARGVAREYAVVEISAAERRRIVDVRAVFYGKTAVAVGIVIYISDEFTVSNRQ